MKNTQLDPRLPLIQDADLLDKIVLVRVDHNVVKKGKILDPHRIEVTLGTLYSIVERGGRLILMTHVGRPRDKATGRIKVDDNTSVQPIANYLESKLHTRFLIPRFPIDPEKGIRQIDTSVNRHIRDLRQRRIGGIYLPNTRWFEGEQAKDENRDRFAMQLAGLADVFINEAFGSWQPDASTCDVAGHLPSYAGFLMQNELINLNQILEPERPFVAVIAGSKYDTKIGTLNEIYKKVDHLILGGVIYNTFLCAKYDIRIAGVSEKDTLLAKDLVQQDREHQKIVELPFVVESEILNERQAGKFSTRNIRDFNPGDTFGYFLDVAPESFDAPGVDTIMKSAKTILVNAVMGFTPNFFEGTERLYRTIRLNTEAQKLFAGGDTLQELKNITPGLYLSAMDSDRYYFFTGGGAVLKTIEEGTPYGLETIKALIENKDKFSK